MGISRPQVHKNKLKVEVEGYIQPERGLSNTEEIAESLRPAVQPPRVPST
jgi:hypothetical protein